VRVLPPRWRPRVTLTVVDCTLASSLAAPPPPGSYERQVLDAHRLYERWTRLDGVFSWYEAFVDAVRERSRSAIVRAARFCFTDPDRFRPAAVKEPLVIFAGRLSEQKRPLLFVDAVARMRAADPALVARHRFAIYGTGVLHQRVIDRIAELGLQEVIDVTHAVDMAPVFGRSQLLVSTQAMENFTSLSMLEAMAAGNAIIAEDVGQTREFVRDGLNGLLVKDATPEAFAAAIATYLRSPERHAAMAEASRTITTDVHTRDNFARDITAFWRAVVADD
jgi:glycosyltransferase involved in cell wall biosynthesis